MTKIFKVIFVNGNEVTVHAHHSSCKHLPNVNKDIIEYYDEDNILVATFQMDKVIGDMLLKIQENDEEKELKEINGKNKRVKIVGFQLPEEEINEKDKEKSKKSKPKSSTKLDGQQKKSKKR